MDVEFFVNIFKFIIRSFFLLVSLIVLFIIYIFSADLNIYKSQIKYLLSDVLNVKINFDSIALSLSSDLSVELKNFTFENAAQKSLANISIAAGNSVFKCDVLSLFWLTCDGSIELRDSKIVFTSEKSESENNRERRRKLLDNKTPASGGNVESNDESAFVFFPFREIHIKPFKLKNTSIDFIALFPKEKKTYIKLEHKNLTGNMDFTYDPAIPSQINILFDNSSLNLKLNAAHNITTLSGEFSTEKVNLDDVISLVRPVVKPAGAKNKMKEDIDIDVGFDTAGANFSSLAYNLNAKGAFDLYAEKKYVRHLLSTVQKKLKKPPQTSVFDGITINKPSVIRELKRMQKKAREKQIAESLNGTFTFEKGVLFLKGSTLEKKDKSEKPETSVKP